MCIYIVYMYIYIFTYIYIHNLPRDMEHIGDSISTIIIFAALKTPMMVAYWGIILLIHCGFVAINNQNILRCPVPIQYLGMCSLCFL